MKVYTYSEARQNLADLLDQARDEGEMRIRRRDGSEYLIRPHQDEGSPLDVPAVDIDVQAEEIVAAVHVGRELKSRQDESGYKLQECTMPSKFFVQNVRKGVESVILCN